jgi:hypothetical protein
MHLLQYNLFYLLSWLFGKGQYGYGGHDNAYLKKAGNAETEVFANLTTLISDNNKVWDRIVDSLYPETTKLFKAILQNE